jgi:alcohol dehydrogenase (cytochrome c)
VNRGVAIAGNRLFMATIDGKLIALDAFNGKALWIRDVADPKTGYTLTLAPLAIRDKILIGTGGGEYGIRGFIAAYQAETGAEVWRFNTVPGPGEPGHETWEGDSWRRGGGSIWLTGSYDAELNLTYWGVGNPGPDFDASGRKGDNLYTDAVVALDADTGKLRWHFQFTPGDNLDYDAAQIPVLVDAEWRGAPRKLMMWANRNGFFYVLDRRTGAFLQGSQFGTVTWAKGLDANGRPIRSDLNPTREGQKIYPGALGVTNWYSPSYSPRTGLFYVPTWVDYYSTFTSFPLDYVPGQRYAAGTYTSPMPGVRGVTAVNTRPESEGSGAVRALDPHTGKLAWEFAMTDVTESGLLTTATDLLFTGSRDGTFYALDARNGKVLWQTLLGGQVIAGPMSYRAGSKQYVSIAAGSTLFTFGLGD